MDEDRQTQVLNALKEASHAVQKNPFCDKDSAIKALLQLQNEDIASMFKDHKLLSLTDHLCNLKSLVHELRESRGLRSYLKYREISRLAASIELVIQAWIDRKNLDKLTKTLQLQTLYQQIKLLEAFESRLSQGFDGELQDSILRSGVFRVLESLLCNPKLDIRVRDQAASAMAALVQFNKDVFVGEVMAGGYVVQALVSMTSVKAIKVLSSLIMAIKSPFVDEIHYQGGIQRILGFLGDPNKEIRVSAMECAMEIAYYGRKEAIEALLKGGVVKRLVELQKSADDEELKAMEMEFAKREKAFRGCVARFAIQMEVGQGLRQRERRSLKGEMLERVREVVESEAEAATIVAEILWGSTP
ncbi:hypothetical protein AMTRI_Chr13g122350 [Amborella trichopoda]|uniref:Nucleotide exchange factor Fes1 domain-containing protein n=1 Tax=Amborella trichopoda TaxID=13333 RepID=U5D9E8_AMBTC|nr:uncharacterized protein LOC18446385 [Amborella trichopoda]ERN18032.1 hypothetical protein AMTR_s00046p00184860 [Amborella trichopoda]|eukprot:XP_006856565.1 uncharacterized protein LOC18446385 [Amborella trichopoda]